MKDLIITINTNTRKVKTTKNFIGINGENLQGNIIFDFENEFIDGVGYLEIDNGDKYIIQMEKEAEHYTLPIKSSLLTKTGKLKIQLRVNINENQENMQVFKSEIIEIPVLEAINATSTIPDEYPGWVKASNINSEEATAGQVLTADGDGGASWQDAGAIDESFKVYFTTTLSGTLTDEEYAEMSDANVVNYNNAKYFYRYQEDVTYLFFACVDGYGIWKFGVNKTTKVLTYMLTKVVASGLNSETATNGQVLTANGNGGAGWESIPEQTPEGTSIKSTGETSGKVLTADGQGGASWENAGGGAPTIITITGNSGYISATDLTTIKNNDNVIILNTTVHKYYYKTLQQTNSSIRFSTVALGDQRVEEIYINWSNGSWLLTTVTIPSKKYEHNITLRSSDTSIVNFVTFSFINNSANAYTTISALTNAIYNITHDLLDCINATGIMEKNSEKQIIVGVYAYSTSVLNARYMNLQTPGNVTYGTITDAFSYINDRVYTI